MSKELSTLVLIKICQKSYPHLSWQRYVRWVTHLCFDKDMSGKHVVGQKKHQHISPALLWWRCSHWEQQPAARLCTNWIHLHTLTAILQTAPVDLSPSNADGQWMAVQSQVQVEGFWAFVCTWSRTGAESVAQRPVAVLDFLSLQVGTFSCVLLGRFDGLQMRKERNKQTK